MDVGNEKYKAILRVANFVLDYEVNNLSELTDNQIVFFESLSIYELNRVFIQSDLLEAKMSLEAIANKYGVSKGHIQDCEKRLELL